MFGNLDMVERVSLADLLGKTVVCTAEGYDPKIVHTVVGLDPVDEKVKLSDGSWVHLNKLRYA